MPTLKAIREQRGITQVELTRQTGLSLGAIRRMESGAGVLATSVRLVAGALGVPVESIEGINIVNRVVRKL